jgi:hypothetical protein
MGVSAERPSVVRRVRSTAATMLIAVTVLLPYQPLHRLTRDRLESGGQARTEATCAAETVCCEAAGQLGCSAGSVAAPGGEAVPATGSEVARSPCCPNGCRDCPLACCGGNVLALPSPAASVECLSAAPAEGRAEPAPLDAVQARIFQPPRA